MLHISLCAFPLLPTPLLSFTNPPFPFPLLLLPTLSSCLSLVSILWRNKILLTKFLRPKLSSSTGITLSIKSGRRHIFSIRVIIDKNFQSACIEDGFRALSKVFGGVFAIFVRVTVGEEEVSGMR
jgi:hypothetical protein